MVQYKKINVIYHINRTKRKKFISIGIEKALNKIQHFFMIKNSYKASNKGKIPQHDKKYLWKPTANIIVVTDWKLPPKIKNETRISIFTTASQHCSGSYSQGKKDKGRGRELKSRHTDGIWGTAMCRCHDPIHWKSQRLHKKATRANKWSQQHGRVEEHMTSVMCVYTSND